MYFFEADIQYSDHLHNVKKDFLFLPELMKIEKVEKVVAYLHETLNHGFVLKKLHRIIKFNQKAWLKSCIEMNTELRKKVKTDF